MQGPRKDHFKKFRKGKAIWKGAEPPLFIIVLSNIFYFAAKSKGADVDLEKIIGASSVLYGVYKGIANWFKHR